MTSDNLKPQSPNATMKMSPAGRARLRATEKAIYRYYNDMGKTRGTALGAWTFSLTEACVLKKS